MIERDLLVAFVAFGLGFAMIAVAVFNDERVFAMRTPNYLSQNLGRSNARMIIGAVGAFTVFLGVSLCAPYLMNSAGEDSSGGHSSNEMSNPTALGQKFQRRCTVYRRFSDETDFKYM